MCKLLCLLFTNTALGRITDKTKPFASGSAVQQWSNASRRRCPSRCLCDGADCGKTTKGKLRGKIASPRKAQIHNGGETNVRVCGAEAEWPAELRRRRLYSIGVAHTETSDAHTLPCRFSLYGKIRTFSQSFTASSLRDICTSVVGVGSRTFRRF